MSISTRAMSCTNILDNLYEGVYIVDTNQKITFWNKGASEITGFSMEDVETKQYCKNLLLHIDTEGNNLCEQRCPVSATIRDGTVRETMLYFHHKNGYRIPVAARVIPLREENGDIVGAIEIFNDLSNRRLLEREIEELRDLAMLDGLTGIRNRRAGEIAIQGKMADFVGAGIPFGVLFFDIDHFKNINDVYGHKVGDDVLKMVAMTLQTSVRPTDVVIRWGGEEMVVVISGDINEEKLVSIAEKLRMLISKCDLEVAGKNITVTVSAGVTLGRLDDTLNTLMERSDMLMYQSKQAGRNTVTMG